MRFLATRLALGIGVGLATVAAEVLFTLPSASLAGKGFAAAARALTADSAKLGAAKLHPRELVQANTRLAFSQPNFEWSYAADPSVKPYHIWIVDDHWAQKFLATGLASARHMTLTLFIDDNTFSSQQLAANVLLNGTVVGSASFAPGLLGTQTYLFSFDPISGPDYRLEIRATNSVSDGGCISIAIGGPSFADLSNVR
jgi:hypothetical protein